MNRQRMTVCVLAMGVAGLAMAMAGASGRVGEPEKKGAGAMSDDAAAACTMFDQAVLDRLKADEGVWDATIRFWFVPGADPVETRATVTSRMAIGGMFLETKVDGGDFGPAMGNQKWSSVSYLGYNVSSKQYEAVRMSSTGSMMMMLRGTEKDSALELSGEYSMGGMVCTQRDIMSCDSPDEQRIVSMMKFGDMPEYKGSEIIMKRRR